MRKTLLLAVVLLLTVASLPALAEQAVEPATPDLAVEAAATDTATATETAAAEAIAAEPMFVDEAEQALTLDVTESAVESAKIPPPWCPFGAPSCWNDDQCDNYCGDPRFGYCFQDTHCCGCTG